MNKKTKEVVLRCPGLYQKYLAVRIAEEFELAGMIRQSSADPKGTIWDRLMRVSTPVKLNPVSLCAIMYPATRCEISRSRSQAFLCKCPLLATGTNNGCNRRQ